MKTTNYLLDSTYYYLSLLFFCIFLASCNEEKPSNIDYPLMAKENQETLRMLSEFAKQEHRFEFKGCEFKYNGKSFKLSESTNTIEKALGNQYVKDQSRFPKRNVYSWFDGFFRAYEKVNANEIESFSYDLTTKESLNQNKYMLIQGAPLSGNMTMGSFIENSNFNWDDFSFSNSSYLIEFSECDKPLKLNLWSDVKFKYIGNGHTRIKGGVDLENTQPVRSVSFSFD